MAAVACYVAGVGKVKSKFERTIILSLQRWGIDPGYEVDKLQYTQKRSYAPDLRLKKKDGTWMYVELKGRFPQDDRTKMRAVKADHPDKDIRFLFMRAGDRITKAKGSMTYGQWAERNKFPWAGGAELPSSWMAELAYHRT